MKFWTNFKDPNSRYPCKHRKPYPKGQFWGSQRPISRDSNVQLSSNFSHSCIARRRIIGEILGQFQRPELEISSQTQETLSKGATLGVTKAHISRLECPTFFKLFTCSCMARRRIIGEILGQFQRPELEISLQTQETLSKGAILGVTKAHISRLGCPTFFKLFTQLILGIILHLKTVNQINIISFLERHWQRSTLPMIMGFGQISSLFDYNVRVLYKVEI